MECQIVGTVGVRRLQTFYTKHLLVKQSTEDFALLFRRIGTELVALSVKYVDNLIQASTPDVKMRRPQATERAIRHHYNPHTRICIYRQDVQCIQSATSEVIIISLYQKTLDHITKMKACRFPIDKSTTHVGGSHHT